MKKTLSIFKFKNLKKIVMKKNLYSDNFLSLSYVLHSKIAANLILLINIILSAMIFYVSVEIGICYFLISISIYIATKYSWTKSKEKE